jgi:hypothetical protein
MFVLAMGASVGALNSAFVGPLANGSLQFVMMVESPVVLVGEPVGP